MTLSAYGLGVPAAGDWDAHWARRRSAGGGSDATLWELHRALRLDLDHSRFGWRPVAIVFVPS
jgi:hypothetical protein